MIGILIAAALLANPSQGTLRPPGNGVVMGRLLALDGTPAAGVRVSAMAAVDSRGLTTGTQILEAIAQTDVSGRYRLENLSAGHYYIVAGLVDSPTYYPGVMGPAAARLVTVTSESTVVDIDFAVIVSAVAPRSRVLSNQWLVRGQLNGIAGPFDEGPRSLLRLIRTDGAIYPGVIHSDGAFQFSDVPSGTYAAALPRLGFQTASNIVVVDRDLTNIQIAVPAQTIIAGRFLLADGSSLADDFAPIEVRKANTFALRSNEIDRAFPLVLIDGEYDFSIPKLPVGYSLKSMEFGSEDITTTPMKVAGPASAEVRIVLYAPVTFTGRVAMEDGTVPPPSLLGGVVATTVSNPNLMTGSIVPLQADGSFTFVLSQDEYRFSLDGLSQDFRVTAMTSGPVDLLRTNLALDGRPVAEIRITLGRRAP